MLLKKLTSLAVAAAMVLTLTPTFGVFAKEYQTQPKDILFDDFNGDSLNTDKWLIAHKQWGGANGGVVKENVSVSDGTLKLEGHGLQYEGDVKGVGKYGADGKLTGAAIATKDYYASGSYEVVAKIAPDLGACSALWTFEYEEYYPGQEGYIPELATYGYTTVNHEIDIEIPTGTNKNPDPNFSSARFNTYTRENRYTPHFHDLGFSLNDGQFHTYRFDWHTGDKNEIPRVEFYIDGQLMYTSTTNIPTKEGRFWIGVWFPYAIDSDKDGKYDTGWSGLADFDTTVFEIDSVKITPFHEANDDTQNETYGFDGWAPNSFPELSEIENYEHIVNGDFSRGDEAWTLSGDATVVDSKAVLTSGNKADIVSQVVNVSPCASYKVSVDVTTDGTPVIIGASKENGSNNQFATVTESGRVTFHFNNDTVNPTLKIYVKVDRWQGSDVKVVVDNISLKGATYVDSPKVEIITSGSSEPIDPVTPTPVEPTPAIPTPTEAVPVTPTPVEPAPVISGNLISNCGFSDGTTDWKFSGSAKVSDGKAVLDSGNDTDTISQIVNIEKGQEYTLVADITSSGSEIEFGVKDYDGRYTKLSETYTTDGKYVLTFKVADHISQIEVFASVLRYQGNKSDCTIDNIILTKNGSIEVVDPTPVITETPETPETPDIPETPVVPVTPDNLLLNPSFDGIDGWTTSGSTIVVDGNAILSTGKDTDTISQTISLEANTTYTFSANIETTGTVVDLKVSDYCGKYSEISNSFNVSGNGSVTFTTGSSAKAVRVTIHVLRYQDTKDNCVISDASLICMN